MFKTRKKIDCCILHDGVAMYMDGDTHRYLMDLQRKVEDLERNNSKLQNELNTIKPVLEKGELKQALTVYCRECRFAVKSKWNKKDILGCCRGCVCDNFNPEEE